MPNNAAVTAVNELASLARFAANTGAAYPAKSAIPAIAKPVTITVATSFPVNASVDTSFIFSVTATGTGDPGGKL